MTLLALTALAAAACVTLAGASPYIDVRVSFKLVLRPENGNRPPTADGHPINELDLQAMLDAANDSLMAAYGRGYRFVLAEPPVEVGWPCTSCPSTDPSFWYGVTFSGSPTLLDFENTAKANATTFAWRTNAINVYINQGKGNGGVSSFPPNDIVVFGATVVDPNFRAAFPGALLHHELGHYFNLKHTFDSQPGCPDTTAAQCAGCGGGDDDVTDTLLDRACGSTLTYALPGWEWMDIALKNYGTNWFDTPAQHAAVDDTYCNNMSYHNGGFPYGRFVLYNLTEGQLDRWTDAADGVRSAVHGGRTWFVSSAGSLSGSGSSTSEFLYVTQGINAAASGGGDIVLMRPGTYLLGSLLSKPLTLRATRKGPAVITP